MRSYANGKWKAVEGVPCLYLRGDVYYYRPLKGVRNAISLHTRDLETALFALEVEHGTVPEGSWRERIEALEAKVALLQTQAQSHVRPPSTDISRDSIPTPVQQLDGDTA